MQAQQTAAKEFERVQVAERPRFVVDVARLDSAIARGESLPKRLLDIACATAGILATSPAWLLIPAAIKLEDRGPVFFAQERVGRGGRSFRSLKFRSMRERNGSGPYQKAELEEERVTRVGRLLRATALDELPQLLNILRGDMSLVGPRALVPEEVVDSANGRPVRLEKVPGFRVRHSVRPGLTGLAQVRARRDIPHRKKFRYDLVYVRSRTLWLDVKLIGLSVWISLRGAWPEVGQNGKHAGNGHEGRLEGAS